MQAIVAGTGNGSTVGLLVVVCPITFIINLETRAVIVFGQGRSYHGRTHKVEIK